MKTGIVQAGPYQGQQFVVIQRFKLKFPGWAWVQLVDESGIAWRDVRKKDLGEQL